MRTNRDNETYLGLSMSDFEALSGIIRAQAKNLETMTAMDLLTLDEAEVKRLRVIGGLLRRINEKQAQLDRKP